MIPVEPHTEDCVAQLDQILPQPEQIELLRALLERGRSIWLTAQGPCMRPWIFSRDRVLLEPLDEAHWGDVVVLSGDRSLLVHRVVETRAGEVRTRGDLSAHDDGWVESDQVLGRVTRVKRTGGREWPLDGLAVGAAGGLAAPLLRRAARCVGPLRRRLRMARR